MTRRPGSRAEREIMFENVWCGNHRVAEELVEKIRSAALWDEVIDDMHRLADLLDIDISECEDPDAVVRTIYDKTGVDIEG